MTETISRSEKKRQYKQDEVIAQQLADLSDNDRKKVPAGPRLKAEIERCSGLKSGARKRQIKYLAKIMRDEDSASEILDFLEARKGSKLKKNKLHHEAERLRDLIINEAIEQKQLCLQSGEVWEPGRASAELQGFAAAYPVDQGDLQRTVFQYVNSRAQKYYREVFRIIKAALEKAELLKKAHPAP